MAKGNEFVLGELIRRGTASGGVLTVRLRPDGVNRSRAEPRYTADVHLSAFRALGYVRLDDKNGYPVKQKMSEVMVYLAKNMSSAACSLVVKMTDASYVGVGFKPEKLSSRLSQFDALDLVGIEAAANEKQDSVRAWSPSDRRESVIASAASMKDCVKLARWIKSGINMPAPEPQDVNDLIVGRPPTRPMAFL